jgi:putative Holliday junction resolvase
LPEKTIQQSENANAQVLPGRYLALDIGEKRIGVAISDELKISIKALPPIQRTSWKRLLQQTKEIIQHYDARALVIGLPLRLDNTAGMAAAEMQRTAEKFRLSLEIPVFLQDEKLTTADARDNLRAAGVAAHEVETYIDSAAAAIILQDFITERQQ